MKNGQLRYKTVIQTFVTRMKNTCFILMLFFFSLSTNAQRAYNINDFFFRSVPGASNNSQVELFDQFLTGDSQKYAVGNHNTLGKMNNRTTSLIVPEGLQVTLWFDKGFRGHKTTFLPGSYVSNWDSGDNWESMKVEKLNHLDGAYFLQSDTKPTDAGWGNKVAQGLAPGTHNYLKNEIICNDCWSYLWVVGSVQIIVYDRAGFDKDGANNLNDPFTDVSPNGTGTMYNLNDYGFNKNISSVEVALLQYGLYDSDREKIGSAKTLNEEIIDLGVEVCNNNEDKSAMTLSESYNVELSNSYSSSFAKGTSVNFGIATTATVTGGVPGFGEASFSIEYSANVGADFQWERTNESSASTTAQVSADGRSLLYGRKAIINVKTTPTTQQYKETLYFRPLKAVPNSEGKYEFAANGKAREKTVVLDVYETKRTKAEAKVDFSSCLEDIINTSASSSGDVSSDNGDNNGNASGSSHSDNGGTMDNSSTTGNLARVNGQTAKAVMYSRGQFVLGNGKTWYEQDLNGKTRFTYEEVSRDEWSVYLQDHNRNVGIHLNLETLKINYKPSSASSYRNLYDITDAL